ncbi:MAG: LCP family protein [Lachnospiraceae bacterium]|nr:LCP family protein [Lachnospiraceae bacterium]
MATSKKKNSKKAKARARRRAILIVEVIVLLFVIIALFVWLKMSKLDTGRELNQPTEAEDQYSEDNGVTDFYQEVNIEMNDIGDETQEIMSHYTNIAFFGVDNRSIGHYSSGNSDTIMICSINNDTNEVKLCSVFRDTFMDIGGGKYQKCNAAYAYGGADQAVAMLNKNLDLNISEYVTVDFNAVVDAVDSVGGVTLNISNEEAKYMNASYIDEVAKYSKGKAEYVKAGNDVLCTGVQATAYCRVRYTKGADFERTYRQRLVLQKLLDKAKASDPATLNNIVNKIFPEVSTSLSSADILEMASKVTSYNIAEQRGWPFEKCTDMHNEASIVVACDHVTNVTELHKFLFGNENYVPSSAVTEISQTIQNKTGKTTANAVDYGF